MNIQHTQLMDLVMNESSRSALLARIHPLMEEIDLTTDCEPSMIGAYNSVAASGGQASDDAMKLVLLKKRGVIDQAEYKDLVLELAKERVQASDTE